MKYLTAEQVLFIHSRLIDKTGGAHGIRDIGLLQSAVARPAATFSGEYLYPDVFRKAAALMQSLIKNHQFIDGDKRTAVTAAALFLERNGYIIRASQKELEQFTLDMAEGACPFEQAVEWFKKHASPRE